MPITYSVSIPQLPQLQAAFRQAPETTTKAVTTAVNRSLVRYQTTAKQLAPVDTGRLRGAIQLRPATRRGNTIEGSVSVDALNYAEYQERGTGIYGPTGTPIRPKRAKMLAWQRGGRWHFAREVRGVRPRWYMRGSLQQNQAATEGYFQQAVDDVTATLAGGGRL